MIEKVVDLVARKQFKFTDNGFGSYPERRLISGVYLHNDVRLAGFLWELATDRPEDWMPGSQVLFMIEAWPESPFRDRATACHSLLRLVNDGTLCKEDA